MSSESFPSRPGLVPRFRNGKTAGLLAALILAGCGGPAEPEAQVVRGDGFSFEAPADWTVTRAGGATAATDGAVDRVEVRVFRLVRPFRAARFEAAARELDGIAARIAKQQSGRVAAKETARVAGRKARSYRIEYDGKVQVLTFVLKDRQEFQLLCRRAAGASGEACELLAESFRLV
jgi:hypothetical protein